MAGRKPDYRLMFVEEAKGKKTYFRIGAGWKNDGRDNGTDSVGIEVNIGLPLVLQPHTKLVLFENTKREEDREELDTEFSNN
jgi:uncharacterized protein (DUF736 family)